MNVRPFTPSPPIPITLSGVTYPSISEASRALGVCRNTILKASRTGVLRHSRGPDATPVSIRGQTFPSAAAAAKHFKVTTARIYSALSRGQIDRVGLPKGGDRGLSKMKEKPVQIFGVWFKSRAALARFIGRPSASVRKTLRQGSPEALKRLEDAVIEAAIRKAKCKS